MEKILFVVDAEEFGGLEIVLLDWLCGIDYSKSSVVLCFRADALRNRAEAWKLPVQSVKLPFPIGQPFWSAFGCWRRLFASLQPEKILLLEGNIGDLSLAPILAARLAVREGACLFAGGGGSLLTADNAGKQRNLYFGLVPRIGLHRYPVMLKHWLRGKLLRRAFVPSHGVLDNYVASLRYPASRIAVLYHGVDSARFRPSPVDRTEFRKGHGIPDDATVVASHGRLARIKRVDRTLKAFELLSSEHQNLWLLLTCYGPWKEEVEKIAANSNAKRRIKLLGFQEDPSKLLKAADLYILSSDREGFGIALVEAMAVGLVCVATNCGGPGEILVNDQDGFLVEPTDEGVLAGLRRAVELSSAERARMAARARKTVEDRFGLRSAIHRALTAFAIPTRN